MNIFVLDHDVSIASKYHCDRHVVKMPLETAQMLCTAHFISDGIVAPYKPTHLKHPCNKWIVESIENYKWLCQLGKSLCSEYTHRYSKIHGCESIIDWCIQNTPNLPKTPMTDFALAMPDEYKCDSAIRSYRSYYISEKKHLHSWKKRDVPFWVIQFSNK